jgi:hypothetical protein
MNKRHPGRPRQIEWTQCRAEGCERTTKGGALGFCHSHYVSNRRGYLRLDGSWVNEVGRRKNYGPDDQCKMPKCAKRAESVGFCDRHYQQYRKGILDKDGHQLRSLHEWRRPRLHEEWIDGRHGYILVQAPQGHPHARQDGSILKHRLVMERHIGRYLKEWEIVHHKNGNPGDNQIDNLELLDGRKHSTTRHPPGHAFDTRTAAQILLQENDLPKRLKRELEEFLREA